MSDLVCLLSLNSDCEGGYEIAFILPKDDDYVKFWMGERFTEGYHKIKPYEDGDVSTTTGNKILFGLQVLYKYSINLELHSEHDQLWAGGKDMTQEEMCVIMSEVDIGRMEKLGWFKDEESWSHWT